MNRTSAREEPLSQEEMDEAQQKAQRAQEVLNRLIGYLGVEASISIKEVGDSIKLDINSEQTGLIIGKKGETLNALQFIINKIVNRFPEGRRMVVIDAEGYRDRRKETLETMAFELGDKVRVLRKTISIMPMNAYDRRIVHMTISKMEGVRTLSDGEGFFRRLYITPEKNNRND